MADESPKEVRADIEQTREEMSRTLEAIADKVAPQKVKARAQEAVITSRAKHRSSTAQRQNSRPPSVSRKIYGQASRKQSAAK